LGYLLKPQHLAQLLRQSTPAYSQKIPVEKITIRNSGKNTLWISSPLQKDTIELAAQSSTEIKASSEIGVSTQKIETPLQPPQEKTEATTLQVLTAVEKDIERF